MLDIDEYPRILLKISGEILSNSNDIHNIETINLISREVIGLARLGLKICIVVGGGNIYRGKNAAQKLNIDSASSDYIGMLATVINALVLQESLSKGVECRVLSAIPMRSVCEPYVRKRALRHIEKDRILIFAGGTGNPFFTTDTAAVLRAVEMNCSILFKGTMVDGVYDSDPNSNTDVKKYKNVSYDSVLSKHLKIMDSSAISLARDNNLPIIVFNIGKPNALLSFFDTEKKQ
ncbi:MAG: UMP kinase, partial [Candidatus Heimdallarchaeota archaeon]|nr:UMP kinase [Candidatus Heimdallarchaeota archaeon]